MGTLHLGGKLVVQGNHTGFIINEQNHLVSLCALLVLSNTI